MARNFENALQFLKSQLMIYETKKKLIHTLYVSMITQPH